MKLKNNVWIRQTEPEPEPEPASTQSPESPVYCYFTHNGSLKAGYANTSQEVVGTRHEHYDLDTHPPLAPSLSQDMRYKVQREIEMKRIREKVIEQEIAKERIREQIIEQDIAKEQIREQIIEQEIAKERIRVQIIEEEIAKERIREQIIMSEIKQRRALEDEIRKDLMLLDAELARRRESNALLLGLPPEPESMELSATGPIGQRRFVDEGAAFSPDKKETLNVEGCVSQGFVKLPIQRGDGDLVVSEVKSVPDTKKGKEEDKTVLLVKPDVNLSGSKRKTVMPPLVDTSKCPSGNISNKKSRGEWSHDLCQVSPPTESCLSLHLQGKKHKMKEASLNSELAGKNYNAGLLPKSPSYQKEIAVNSSLLKSEDLSIKINEDLSQVLKPGDLKKKQVETVQEIKRKCDQKSGRKYWCELCQVGTPTKKHMGDHMRGKKHLKRLKKSQNSETGKCNKEKKTAVDATCFQEVAKDCQDVNSYVAENKCDETEEKMWL